MSRRRRHRNRFLKGIVLLFGGTVLLGAAVLVLYVLVRGLSQLSYEMLINEPSLLFNAVGVMPAIVNTILTAFVVALVAMPFGLLASLVFAYIKCPRSKAIFLYMATLAAELPPVVYGLLGMLVFCQWFGMGVSVLAGSCTMAVMLAIEVMASAEAYQTQQDLHGLRQAASLGASSGQLVYSIRIPNSIPLTFAGFLRAIARVMAETIALLLTLGAGTQLAGGLESAFVQSGGTLSVMMYIYVQQRGDFDTGFAIAALLLLFIGSLIVASNLGAARLARRQGR